MDNPWEKAVMEFLKRTRDELVRTGDEMRAEAQKMLEEMRDPSHQQRLRETLNEMGTWARQTAEEAGHMIETAVSRAQHALVRASQKASDRAQPKRGGSRRAGKRRKAAARKKP